MYTGMIFSIDKNTVVVATPENAFYKLKRKSTMFIGQEIVFTKKDIIDYRYLIKRLSVVAACLCLIIGMSVPFVMNRLNNIAGLKEFAYVSLDINPSMEFTIDETQKVLKVESLNDDAKGIINSLNVKGMRIKSAFTEVISRCEEKGFLNTEDDVYFLISGSINPDNKEYKKDNTGAEDSLNYILNGLKESVGKTTAKNPEVIAIKTEPGDRKEAIENDISQGKYALYTELKKRGSKITIGEVKSSTVKDLITILVDMDAAASATPKPEITPQPTLSAGQTSTTTTPTSTSTPTITPTPVFSRNQTMTKSQDNMKTPGHEPSSSEDKAGTGLRGEYFDNIDLTNFKLTRVDGTVDFSWDTNSPASEIRDDESYSIRWTGKIKPKYSEEYTFYVLRDNGVRLWINNKLIIDKWDSEWAKTDYGTISLEGGRIYDIKLEYFNNTGYGFIKLEWSSKSTNKEVVPASCLYPAKATASAGVVKGNGTGLRFEYFDNDNLTNLKLEGIDPIVDFNWGVGSPDRSIQQDQKFSIRWSGQVQPVNSENYVFYLTHDDGVRLWIDGQLVLDKWSGSEGKVSESTGISLKAGKKYKIILEYHNSSQAGNVKLEWKSPSTKRTIVPKACLYPQ
ncbi:PA14 domain-containing protein [Acetivibrio cellulolyticus]|uniref:PA14 domain-containing protein n=1 Tax=Acetivibrio cellulolyticus TaxID=35830 RepID=UPI0001E2C1D4|nr:PA14 domain-containing protein [Acetivibrio cellulolyticus]